MGAILDRLKEPSSWAAVTALIAGVFPTVPTGVWQYVAAIGGALTGLLGIFLSEKSQ